MGRKGLFHMFKNIEHIDDVQPYVSDKQEIRFLKQSNGITFGCYLFMDAETFTAPEALECRGIAFDPDGKIISRPLHKFFNVGEHADLALDDLLKRDDIVCVFDKLDGSMIATAWVDGALAWRSKKSFGSPVVRLAQQFLALPENANIVAFSEAVAARRMTAIFELTHPEARIVVKPEKPQLQLLHVRDNVSGQYVMLDAEHDIHRMIEEHNIPKVHRYAGAAFPRLMSSIMELEGCEGYVAQFANGDMVKIKCPWYVKRHKCMTGLRERDIAAFALAGELDDIKQTLREMEFDLSVIEAVEARVKDKVLEVVNEVEAVYQASAGMDRKSFAIKHKEHVLFGMLMIRFQGAEPRFTEWYTRHRLRDDFSLAPLVGAAAAEAIES
jgi:RNA ligase